MAYKEVSRVELAEVIRRWQAGSSQRHIASGTGLSRDTVRNYMVATRKVGVRQEGPAPTEEQLSLQASVGRSGPRRAGAPTDDLLAPWADQVYRWLTIDHLQLTRIQELLAQRGCRVPYTSLRRFIQRRNWRRHNPRTVRMEASPPGEVAEMGLRAPGVHPRPTEWPPSHGVGPDCGTGLLQAQLRLAHTQPETAGGDRRPGSGLGVLRRRPQTPGHRQLPRRGGRCRRAAPQAHQGLHHRPRTGCVTPGTSPTSNGVCGTYWSASSRAGSSGTWSTSGMRRTDGVGMSPDSGSMAPPDDSLWRSLRKRNVRHWLPGMASPTRSPISPIRPAIYVTARSSPPYPPACSHLRLPASMSHRPVPAAVIPQNPLQPDLWRETYHKR